MSASQGSQILHCIYSICRASPAFYSRLLGRREQTTGPLSGFWLPPAFPLEKGSLSAAHSRNSSDSELLEVCRLGAQARHRQPLEGAGKEHGGKAGDRRDGDRDKNQGL